MSELETRLPEGEDFDIQGNRCHPHFDKKNYCNDTVLTWGSDKCRKENETLAMSGGAANCAGYAIPRDAVIHSITATWDKDECGGFNETLVLQINGQDVEGAAIVASDALGTDHVCLTKLKVNVNECDTVNIVSRRSAEDECWEQACNVEVAVYFEMECNRKLHLAKEGDGVIEALDTTGVSTIGTAWTVRALDTVRTNTMPAKASFSDTGDYIELKEGVYKIWYGAGLATKQSTNLVYETVLEIDDGSGWAQIPFSGNNDHDLSGDKGAMNCTRMITYTVPHGQAFKFRLMEKVSADTSIQVAESGASLLIERVANGLGWVW